MPGGPTYVVGASQYGGPSDPSSGTVGSCGKDLRGTHAFAELYMGTALGGLPCGTKVLIQNYGGGGATVEATKMDIGLGGAPVSGHARRVDLWYQTAQAMGFSGTGLVRIRRVDGKPIIGPNDKEKSGEAIGAGILGTGIGPDTEKPGGNEASEKFKEGVENVASWTGELGKILNFIGSSSGWVRIGKVVLGAGLLVIALSELTKISPPVSAGVGVAKKVVK